MESDNSSSDGKSLVGSEKRPDLIKVRATITCPSCDYLKVFKNQYLRAGIEMMIVALKVFDWLTCTKCGDLLLLNLEFEI